MALSPIRPLCFNEFDKVQTLFANWVVDYVDKNPIHGRSGWLHHLQAYDYSRRDHERDAQPVWQKGELRRVEFNNRLRSSLAGDNQALIGIVNEIMEWGGMKPYDAGATPKIRQALQALDMEKTVSIWNTHRVNEIAVTRRIAARTKIFEMYDLDKWVIYDSRLAVALACLTDHNLKSSPGSSTNTIRWPIPQGRPNESRVVQGFPGAHTPYQASLGFLYASWLCRMIAQRLSSQQPAPSGQIGVSPGGWRTFHVEMVLWTLGSSRF
jgi:hypothetical protein